MDTSAFVKLFVSEAGSVSMTRFAMREPDDSKIICALAAVEARSALLKLNRTGKLTAELLALALAILNAELSRHPTQAITPAVIDTASVLVERFGLRTLDAIQLASAIIFRSGLVHENVRFIASDQALLRAAAAERFQTWNPETDQQS